MPRHDFPTPAAQPTVVEPSDTAASNDAMSRALRHIAEMAEAALNADDVHERGAMLRLIKLRAREIVARHGRQ